MKKWDNLAKLVFAFAFALALTFGGQAIYNAISNQSNAWSPTTGTVSGLQLSNNYNNGFSALLSSNSGATAPSNDQTGVAVKGQWWLDTSGGATANVLKYYDGTSWLTVGTLDTSAHQWKPVIGGGNTTVASAATTNIGAQGSTYLSISGSATITSFGSAGQVGTTKILTFTGAAVLTDNANIVLPNNGSNITAAAGDTAVAVQTGSGIWTFITYVRADGTALNTSSNLTGAVFFNNILSPSALASGSTNNYNPTGLSTANTIRLTGNAAGSTLTGITAPVTTGKILLLDNIGTGNITLAAEHTSSTAGNRFGFPAPYVITPGTQVGLRYDLTTARWRFWQSTSPQLVVGGYSNLRVFNNATAMGDTAPASPNTQIKIAADQIAVQTEDGLTARLTSYSCTVASNVSGAGGLDTGTIAAGNWYFIFVIYNPAVAGTTSCLLSLNSDLPSIILPSGYTFAARVGAAYYVTANAVTGWRRFVQYGDRAHYVVVSASNTNLLPVIISGNAGSNCTTATPTWDTSGSVATIIPPTSGSVFVIPHSNYNAVGNSNTLVAPSNTYGGPNATVTTNPAPIALAQRSDVTFQTELILQGTTIAYCSGTAGGGAVQAEGWRDNL